METGVAYTYIYIDVTGIYLKQGVGRGLVPSFFWIWMYVGAIIWNGADEVLVGISKRINVF